MTGPSLDLLAEGVGHLANASGPIDELVALGGGDEAYVGGADEVALELRRLGDADGQNASLVALVSLPHASAMLALMEFAQRSI